MTESTPATPYVYTPLSDSESFRLLRLHRSEKEFHCHLKVFPINQSPKYSALSYTWGPPLTTSTDEDYKVNEVENITVFVNNDRKLLPIGKNLFEGLCQIVLSTTTEYLWVDSICINQRDDLEKTSQVSLMGRIFAGADNVVVWLGKDDTNFEDFKWFHEVFLPKLKEYAHENGMESVFRPDWGNHRTTSDRLHLDAKQRWVAYARFYEERRWFRRAWVLQEVALAKRIIVLCGESILSWEDMTALSAVVVQNGMGLSGMALRTEKLNMALGSECTSLNASRALLSASTASPVDTEFIHSLALLGGYDREGDIWSALFILILYALATFNATLAHDKIYAALGVIQPSTLTLPVLPNYKLSVENVFMETTFALVQRLPQLSILSMKEDLAVRGGFDLPSWVPDFTSSQSHSNTLLFLLDDWNASGAGKKPSYVKTLQGTTLELTGASLDTVATVLMPFLTASLPVFYLWIGELFDLIRNPGTKAPYEHKKIDAISRAIICNRTVPITTSKDQNLMLNNAKAEAFDPICYFRSYTLVLMSASWRDDPPLKEYQSSIQSLTELINSEPEATRYLFTESDVLAFGKAYNTESPASQSGRAMQRQQFAAQQYAAKVASSIGGKRVYQTEQGYIGLGPQSIQPGDEIWILRDARVLFALRQEFPEAKKYVLLGETYLHGCMHGEAMTDDLIERIGLVFLV